MPDVLDFRELTVEQFTEQLVKYSKDLSHKRPKFKEKLENSGNFKHGYKTVTFCVFAPFFALLEQSKIEEYIAQLDIKCDLSGEKEHLHKLLCELLKSLGIAIKDKSKRPDTKPYYGTLSIEKFLNKEFEQETKWVGSSIKDIVNKDTKVRDALEVIQAQVNENAKQEDYQSYMNAIDAIFSVIGGETMDECIFEDYEKQIKKAIENGAKQIILTGAPGTGKTRMAKEIAKELSKDPLPWKKGKGAEGQEASEAEKPHFELVQFHPSYDYTDFVEGLRPVENGDKVEFRKLDGTFKHFCRLVAEQNIKDRKKDNTWKEKKYFFIIDEINRADLSKVFGELMYCLESDKRGENNNIQTQYQNLSPFFTKREDDEYKLVSGKESAADRGDVFADGFYIPENVIIIGTMNDIDRSVESMDFALRRRFLWREIEVSETLLKSAFQSDGFWGSIKPEESIRERIAERVMEMNDEVIAKKKELGLNRQYYISQGQFANLPTNITDQLPNAGDSNKDSQLVRFLTEVFEWRIKPLLREYVRGEDEKTINDFVTACGEALGVPTENDLNTTSEPKVAQ